MKSAFVASAITDILLNSASGPESNGTVCLVLPRSQHNSNTPIQPSACSKSIFQKSPDQRTKVLAAVRSNLSAFLRETGPGVVCLVYSVILTKGVQELTADMDMEDIVLINEYGYAS